MLIGPPNMQKNSAVSQSYTKHNAQRSTTMQENEQYLHQ